MFRKMFESSPCIWAEEANLQIHRIACSLNLSSAVKEKNIAVVFCERTDQYKIEGKWLKIPINGVFDVDLEKKQVLRWKGKL